jgi:crotonobetainyl-CoA:carnitine CoA-transferase CaiB-like acyl-CoA transferase
VELDQPEFGPVRQLGFPVKLSRTPADIHRSAPALGEHTAELLQEAGYSAEEVSALEESGAAKGPDAAQTAEAFRA